MGERRRKGKLVGEGAGAPRRLGILVIVHEGCYILVHRA